MKILHVFDHSIPLQSGYSFRSRAILRAQRARGWQPVALTGPKQGTSPAAVETLDDLTFYRTPPATGWLGRGLLEPLGVIRAIQQRLLEVARREQPDILHAHSPALNGVAAVRVGRTLNIPVVYEVRAFWEDAAVDHGTSQAWGPRYRLTRALETWVLRRANAVTTICEGLRAEMAGRGIPASRLTVIPNAVEPEAFATEGQRDPALVAQLGLEPEAQVLGFVGSFYAYEGLDLLIEAFAVLADRHPNLRLLLVGGGPEDTRLRAQAKDSPAAARIHFTGRVPHAEVSRYYDLIDLLAYPRHPMRLTELVTPLKPLEAMAGRKLFVASDVGGHRELVEHERTGFLFQAGDARALADCVSSVLGRSADWERIRAAGLRHITEERTWTQSVARYVQVYADAQAQRTNR
jgi:PEP-CTERM/exosortase A-associated glycosyltransferase